MWEQSPFLLETPTCLLSARFNFAESVTSFLASPDPHQTHVPGPGLDFWQGTPTVLGGTAPCGDFIPNERSQDVRRNQMSCIKDILGRGAKAMSKNFATEEVGLQSLQ